METVLPSSTSLRLAICATAAFAICCRSAATPAIVPPVLPTQAFNGILRDSLTPVPDVSIGLYRGSSLVATARTDTAGRFTFGPQLAGDYRFSVSSSRYAPCGVDVSFSPGQGDVVIGVVPASDTARLQRQRAATGNLCSCRLPMTKPAPASRLASRKDLPLPDASRATLAVDVIDPYDGEGVYRADVVLSPDPGTGRDRIGAYTDATGRAIFLNLPAGKYDVLVRRIAFVPNRTEVVAIPGAVDSLVVPIKWDVSQLCITVRTGQ
jgi:hypothetical protein